MQRFCTLEEVILNILNILTVFMPLHGSVSNEIHLLYQKFVNTYEYITRNPAKQFHDSIYMIQYINLVIKTYWMAYSLHTCQIKTTYKNKGSCPVSGNELRKCI